MNRLRVVTVGVSVASLQGLSCRCLQVENAKGKGARANKELLDQVWLTLKNVRHIGINESGGPPAQFECRGIASSAETYIKKDPDVTTIRNQLAVVTNTIVKDVSKYSFLWVEPERSKYIDSEKLFDTTTVSVSTSFPHASAEFKAAGNCFAAECPTAAVFHLMRGVEWGIRALCVHLGMRRLRCQNARTKRVTFKPLPWQQWEPILNQAEGKAQVKIDALKPGPKKQALQVLYIPIFQDLRGFQNAFRNHVMHTRVDYTSTETQAIFARVETFMQLLATRVREV